MKKQLLAFVCALILLTGTLPASGALEGEALRAADTLALLNLVDAGGAEADYNLNTPATRTQAAVLLVRLAGAEAAAESAASTRYLDVPAWAAPYVAYASRQGWVSGVSDVSFAPNGAVTADTWCTMLLRMLGYRDRDGDFTVTGAALFAQRIGLVSRRYEGALTRGDVFEIMYGALTFPYKDGSGTVLERLVSKGVCDRSAVNALGLLNPELTAREISDRFSAAVFQLELYKQQSEVILEEPSSTASGFFITADGLAVTNYHSIEDGIQADVVLSTGETYPVESVLYYDAAIDVAVIRVSRISTSGKTTSAFACLETVSSQDVYPGDTVYTLGSPLGLGLSVSSGVVSAIDREVESYALPCIMNTAPISRGSSGGALMNVYGQVVGITTGAYTYGNSMFLAVPIDPVLKANLTAHSWTLEEVTRMESAKGSSN